MLFVALYTSCAGKQKTILVVGRRVLKGNDDADS